MPTRLAFHYDLGDPECWLVAERITTTLPVLPEFVPVLGRQLGTAGRQAPDREAPDREAPDREAPDREAPDREAPDREALARRAAELGLLPMRWPAAWPLDSELAALTATFAASIGKVVAFSLAAFRQTFAAGRDPAAEETVLIAAAACEIHPRAVLGAVRRAAVADALRRACERTCLTGVRRLPAISAGELVFEGESCPEEAAAALAEDPRAVR